MIDFTQYDYLDTEISAKVILDSISQSCGKRATTMLWRIPRFILPQVNTHRAFSRNVASSRAKRFIALLKDAVYMPVIWLKNHKGMQGDELLEDDKIEEAERLWAAARDAAIYYATEMDKLGLSKQYVNRIIEPYCYVDYLVTSTEWDNFLVQRDDSHAQFEIQVLARRVRKALAESTPTELKLYQWHLPFVGPELQHLPIYDKVRISAARCARTSYGNNQGRDIEADFQLYNILVHSKPPHLSPVEHQLLEVMSSGVSKSGNIEGFLQFRKLVEQLKFDANAIEEYITGNWRIFNEKVSPISLFGSSRPTL
jgi:hypothetical protein